MVSSERMKIDDLYPNDQDTVRKQRQAIKFNRLRRSVDVDGIEVDAGDEFLDEKSVEDQL